jgi:primosomal protein N' (replication factor Y)
LPLALPQCFTYSVPDELSADVQKGVRVIVPVGTRKFYSAIVSGDNRQFEGKYSVKDIVAVLDGRPVVNDIQLKLWQWISSYYMCTLGEVMKAAVPSGLKLESETKVYFNVDYVQSEELDSHEEEILNIVFEKRSISIKGIAEIYRHRNLMRVIQSLVNKEALWIEEEIAGRYKPRFEHYVRLHPSTKTERQFEAIFGKLEKAPKQLDILVNYIRLSHVFSERPVAEVSRKELLKAGNAQADALNSLLKKEIMELYVKEISRLDAKEGSNPDITRLTPSQEHAFRQIRELFESKDIVLLHGVTSSGKTEVYIHLIEEQLSKGKQVLYLLPEIALTAQIICRLKNVFGNKVGIYHSKYSDAERVEVWNNVMKPDGYRVVLGVRSGIFLPFSDLGLVIVDEEHENTYKQYDTAPRYHARDSAIILASLHRAKTLLGTATPSMESYCNAQENKYGLVELSRRYSDIALPEIEIVNTRAAGKNMQMQSHFHPELLDAIGKTLQAGKQVILFRNRRGFAPYVQCRICGAIPHCKYCDVSLTYHKHTDRLVCHYCGFSTENITKCAECNSLDVHTIGFGTEKVEDEIQIFFPKARIARLDLDNSRSRNSHEKIIHAFARGDMDILVGTQMVSKGLDFENVHLVGILDADSMLNYPDFRAFERSYHLMAQVGGRAGRAGKRGKVMIQASNPQHPILQYIINNDYKGMYEFQLTEREKYRYPPFYRLIRLTVKHKSREIAHQASAEFAAQLTAVFGQRVLGPQIPLISRIQTYYLEHILIKIEKTASVQKAKALLNGVMNNLKQMPDFKSLQIIADVDPV